MDLIIPIYDILGNFPVNYENSNNNFCFYLAPKIGKVAETKPFYKIHQLYEMIKIFKVKVFLMKAGNFTFHRQKQSF